MCNISMSKFQAGIFLIGMGIGVALPSFPDPLSILNPWIWIILVIVGTALVIKN